jgi:saposin
MIFSSHSMAGANYFCLALGLVVLLCGAGEGRSVGLGQEAAPQRVCDACLEFTNEAQIILSDPDTQKQAIEAVSQMVCQSLTPRLKDKCLDLVKIYVPNVFLALQARLDPEMCVEAGLCTTRSTHYIDTRGRLSDWPQWADKKTCGLCEDFANDALSYLESNATQTKLVEALHLACSRLEGFKRQCDILVDVYAPDFIEHVSDLTPEEVCEITRLCTSSRKPAVGSGVASNTDCTFCQFVVLELKLKLRDPVTQEKLLEVLLNGCGKVQNHVDECRMIVIQYAPFILANLDNILDADALCSRIGACPARNTDAFESVLAMVV